MEVTGPHTKRAHRLDEAERGQWSRRSEGPQLKTGDLLLTKRRTEWLCLPLFQVSKPENTQKNVLLL